MSEMRSVEQINTGRNLFFMSVPMFVELLLQLLVGNIDQMMVSRVSQNSVAAIVNANQIMNIVIVTISMAATATPVLLSQLIGAHDRKGASQAASVSMLAIGVVGVLATLLIFLFVDPIYQALHVPAEVVGEARAYLLIVAAFILVQGLYQNFAAILRTYTLMKEVMYVSVVMNLLNIVGNAVLIFGLLGLPALGAVGAAVSTCLSKTVGLALMYALYRRKVDLPMGPSFLRPFPKQHLKKFCLLAVPSGVENLSYNLSQACILGIINTFGTVAVVTKGYCAIFANFSYIYAVAIAQAAQIVMGYLIGAGKIEALQKRVASTRLVAICACVGFSFLIWLSSDVLFLLFTTDAQIIALGKQVLLVEIVLELGRAMNIVMTRALIAVGDIKTPIGVGIAFQWAVALAGAWLLGQKLGLGLTGVWVAMALDECLRGLIFSIQFARGRWKKNFPPLEHAMD